MDKHSIEKEFTALIHQYSNVIWKVCYIYAKDRENLNDLYQEAIINLWKGFPKFRKESKPSTWIYRIALNSCITFFRRFSRHPQTLRLTESWDFAYEENVFSSQIQELYALIHCLGNIERALILLWLEEKSYAEIAIITGLSQTNVATKLCRIKEKLKKMSNQ